MSEVVPLHGAPPSDSASGESTDDVETRQTPAPSGEFATDLPPTASAVSRYVVLEELGRGGMGRVLRAYDPKLQREVALKEVRRDVLDDESTARLVAEARAMAKLSHPNVVSVYDVEELASEEVVLVMEYVAGATLRQWLRDARRAWREVLGPFVAAGRGLVAAHGAGLLHRDFKPANVLVASDGTVKVTDFGLAKPGGEVSQGRPPSVDTASLDELVDGDSGSAPLTEEGMILGTPRYMAPEQFRGEPLSAAVDQYAFCIALWEALCGAPPFSGKSVAKDKHSGPPRWPEPATPRPIADAIVRGLSAKAEDRWPSMEALLEALSWDPRRSRNRWLAALGCVGLLGIAGVSYQGWAEARARRCSGSERQLAGIWDESRREELQAAILGIDKSYAQGVWARTEEQLDAYAAAWAAMHTEACEATTVRGEQSAQMLDLRMGCLHRAAVELDAAVDVLAEADAEGVQKAHKVTGGLRPLSRCADTEALAAEVEPPLPEAAEAVDAARTLLARAGSLEKAGRYDDAKRAIEEAETTLEGVEYEPVRTDVALLAGEVLNDLGQYEASEAALTEALERAAQWHQWEAMGEASMWLMYVVGDRQGRMDEAQRLRPVVEGLSQGNPEAEASFRNTLGLTLRMQGKHTEAEAEYRAALALWQAALGPNHPDVAVARSNLAVALGAQGRHAEAEAEHRAVLALRQRILGPDHPDVTVSRNNLAVVLHDQGKSTEAEAKHRVNLAIRKTALGPDHPHVAASRSNLAVVLRAQGKHAEAEAESRAALASWLTILGPDHADVALSRNNLAAILRAQGKNAEAEAEYRAALAIRLTVLGPDHADVALSRTNLARILLELDRPNEALPFAEQAWTRHQRDDIPTRRRSETAFLLADILWTIDGSTRDRPRARELAKDALVSYRRAGDPGPERAAEVERWLDTHR